MRIGILLAISIGTISGCATTPPVTYVAPPGVVVEGDGVGRPNDGAPNVATLTGLALPFTTRTLILRCPDGSTETKQFVNDGLNPISMTGIVLFTLWSTSSFVGFGDETRPGFDRNVSLGVALSTGAAALFMAVANWQPSRGITVDHPGTVCREKAPPPSLPPSPTTSPAPGEIEKPPV